MSKKELQLRKDIPVELTWDLTLIYQNTDEWEKDFAALDELVNIFNAYQGRLSGSAAVLNDAIAALDSSSKEKDLPSRFHWRRDSCSIHRPMMFLRKRMEPPKPPSFVKL